MNLTNDWPNTEGDAPTAWEIAKTLLRAAEATGETERLKGLADQDDAGAFSNAMLRARWLALDILLAAYPRCGVKRLARPLGARYPTQGLDAARKTGWWSVANTALAA